MRVSAFSLDRQRSCLPHSWKRPPHSLIELHTRSIEAGHPLEPHPLSRSSKAIDKAPSLYTAERRLGSHPSIYSPPKLNCLFRKSPCPKASQAALLASLMDVAAHLVGKSIFNGMCSIIPQVTSHVTGVERCSKGQTY